MLKKIIVISFNLIFLVATTGLPLSVHLCKIMKNGSMQSCSMKHNENMHHCRSICEDENDFIQQKIAKADCCEIIPFETVVTDKFVSFKTELNHDLNLIAFVNFTEIEKTDSQNAVANFLNDPSPPSQDNNHIYLDNSILLI